MIKATVDDIMTEHIVMIKDDATIMQAAHILLRFRINGLLVIKKGTEDEVVGVLTTTDLLRVLDNVLTRSTFHKLTELEKISGMPAMDIASRNILKVQKKAKVTWAVGMMHKKNIHTIPVYDGDKLVGVVGKHDILNAAFHLDKL